MTKQGAVPASKSGERGSALIEFCFVGIPVILILVSTFGMAITMWNYHTLAYAVREGARLAATHGLGCASASGNNCAVTVSDIANRIAATGVGLSPSSLNITLRSSAGDVPCKPLNICFSDSTVWPPTSVNAPGSNNYIEVLGYYPGATSLIMMFWPGQGGTFISPLTLSASTRQIIEF